MYLLSVVVVAFLSLVTDLHMAVAVEAIQAIGNLARGLRTHFSGSLHFLLLILLVQQQVIKVVTYLASSATRFPKKCVVLCLFGISERVADIKTRAHAMKCLTSFSEAVGPGFVFERLYKIMKEHKNPKVLSEGLLWMVSTVEDFGISHLKLKFSAAATRNATIKILGALHKFIGPDIKGFLTDVKAALLSELDAEYEKNPFEGTSAAPKKTVKASESTSLSAGGLDSLPREDISGKITPTLLKSLESPDWKLATNALEWVAPLTHAVDGSRATLHDQCLNLPTIIQNDTGPNRLD
ncbi:hypothetical protein REPUB_Repub03eG0000300 [Reevesia pubescens]